LRLWFNLRGGGKFLTDREPFEGKRFAIGGDVSFGTGASNSAGSVVDLTTGQKVAAWADPHTEPKQFADELIALAKWFKNAFLIWDASGAGGKTFTMQVMERQYSRIYYRQTEVSQRTRISDRPGYYLNPQDRAVLLQDYRMKLEKREFINYSEPGMRECLQFIVHPGGKVEHSAATNSQDPRGAREAHGDEAIADALASRALSMKKTDIKQEEIEPPWMSPAWRLREEQRELVAASGVEGWVD
jgi:hypothetical protein